MTDAEKHKTKTKNDTYKNNILCAIVRGIQLIFCPSLKLQFNDSLLRAIFALFNCNEWFYYSDWNYESLFILIQPVKWDGFSRNFYESDQTCQKHMIINIKYVI